MLGRTPGVPDVLDDRGQTVGNDARGRARRRVRRAPAHPALQVLGGVEIDIELASDGFGDRIAAHARIGAGEARNAPLVHHDVGETGADSDHRLDSSVRIGAGEGRERSHECERHGIHCCRVDAAPLRRRQVGAHHLAMGGRQQYPHPGLAVGRADLVEDLEVEDGVLDRDRDQFLGLELERGGQVAFVHEREIGRADDHALAGYTRDDGLAAEATLTPEAADGGTHGFGIDDLAVAHRSQGRAT